MASSGREGAASAGRFAVLDGMRGVAAILVMFYHYTTNSTVGSFMIAGRKITNFEHGWLAVDFFFALSGFVIDHAYGDRLAKGMSGADFFVRRCIRLYPMITIGLLLGVTATMAGSAAIPAASLLGFAAINFALLPTFNHEILHDFSNPTPAVGTLFLFNPPAWSLFFEMFASASFIGLRRLPGWGMGFLAGGAFLGLAALAWMNGDGGLDFGMGASGASFLGGFPRVVFGFYAGVLLHRLWRRQKLPSLHSPEWLYVALAAALLFPFSAHGAWACIFLLAIGPALVFAGAQTQKLTPAQARWAERLGWLSYPVYCVHHPIGRLVWALGAPRGLPDWALVAIAACLTLIVASAGASLIEEPARAWLTNLQRRRPQLA